MYSYFRNTMKTFILYNKSNNQSVINANLCLDSFNNYIAWNAELFDGCTPNDLEYLERKYNLKDDRARYQPSSKLYKSKKACFFSHFILWNKCIEINQPIAIVEHDTYCIGNLPESFTFNSIVQFSTESMFNHFSYYKESQKIYKTLAEGLYPITKFPPLKNWGYCIAGNTGYGITPTSAKILVDDCFKNGWQQNDLLMSESLCKIEVLVPSLIVYDSSRELHSSSIEL